MVLGQFCGITVCLGEPLRSQKMGVVGEEELVDSWRLVLEDEVDGRVTLSFVLGPRFS